MVEFLTPEWLSELDAVARHSSAFGGLTFDADVVIEQRVHGGPKGDVQYHLAIDRTGARVRGGPADAPMLVLVTDYPTAVALHRGTTNLQHALASGGAQVRGDPRLLVRYADALSALGDVFAAVRAATTYAPTA